MFLTFIVFLFFELIIEALNHRLHNTHTASVIRKTILTFAFIVELAFSCFHCLSSLLVRSRGKETLLRGMDIPTCSLLPVHYACRNECRQHYNACTRSRSDYWFPYLFGYISQSSLTWLFCDFKYLHQLSIG